MSETNLQVGMTLSKILDKAKQDTENPISFIERIAKRFDARYDLDNMFFLSHHASKAMEFKSFWETQDVPFKYGAFVYAMSFHPRYKEDHLNPHYASRQDWVVHTYNKNPDLRRILQEEDTGKAFFTLYWLHGKRDVIEAKPAEPIHEAFTRAGYGAGAIRGLDFFKEGEDDSYIWNSETKEWELKVPIFYTNEN